MAKVGLYARVYVGNGKSKWVRVEVGKNGRPIPIKGTFTYCIQFSQGDRQCQPSCHTRDVIVAWACAKRKDAELIDGNLPATQIQNPTTITANPKRRCPPTMGDGVILFGVIQERRPAEGSVAARLILFRIVDLHGHEARRIGVGERLHQDVVDHAEDSRGGTDAQGQGQDRDSGEAQRFAQVPESEADILTESSPSSPFPERGNALYTKNPIAKFDDEKQK